ncbi:MAG TPA: hypothetical protein DCK87_09475, partial [Desulfotomaculum sp.]|nr:hypothetical protein [Desulfotomaculum sp.]
MIDEEQAVHIGKHGDGGSMGKHGDVLFASSGEAWGRSFCFLDGFNAIQGDAKLPAWKHGDVLF